MKTRSPGFAVVGAMLWELWRVTRVEAAPSELMPPAGLAQRISTEFLGKL